MSREIRSSVGKVDGTRVEHDASAQRHNEDTQTLDTRSDRRDQHLRIKHVESTMKSVYKNELHPVQGCNSTKLFCVALKFSTI